MRRLLPILLLAISFVCAAVTLQQRHDTAANWTSVNPTLAAGEIGVETDTGKFKIGDGSTSWTGLSYPPSAGSTHEVGSTNFAIGTGALDSLITGSFNVAFGLNALTSLTANSNNVAIGAYALYSTTGHSNIGIGADALISNTTGTRNTAVGMDSLFGNTTGSSNVGIGENAGSYITGGGSPNETSSYSIYIGSNSRALSSGSYNEIVVGQYATGLGTNSVTIGNDEITKTALKGDVGVGTTSPGGLLGLGDANTYLDLDGSDNLTFTDVVSGTKTLAELAAGGGSVAVIADQKTSGTNGGSSSVGVQVRDLNTEVSDPDGIVSISSNQFTLEVGEYFIQAFTPSYLSNHARAIIYNATDSTTIARGPVDYASAGNVGNSISPVSAIVTIGSAKAFEIRQYISTATATNGLGVQSGDGNPEIYTEVNIHKLH